ncbi:MAG TPA: hypothetical protein VJ888_03230 [Mobilitalea sp.]|nr:hypothetical protein [Mobilitalea sp.]
MKKIIQVLLILSTLLLLTGCSNKKDSQHPVSIGNLAFSYDENIWTNVESTDKSTPLEFKDSDGNLVNIFVSQESTYQHPLEMISFIESMVSTYDQYEVFLDPTETTVNGTSWYEFGYSFHNGTTIQKVYQRYYGKYYNAASISYNSTEEKYETGINEALKMMSDIKVTDVTNDVNEAKAQEFLVGEWELVNSGYLVLYDSGAYEWYKDNTKDKNNMHHGTFGCDVENATMNLNEGDGIYLVLFPEGLIINGVTQEPTGYKMDYIISFDKKESEGYQMVNMSSYSEYTLFKQ